MPTQYYRLVFPNSRDTPGIVLKVGKRSQLIIDKTDTYRFERKEEKDSEYVMFFGTHTTDASRTSRGGLGTFVLKDLDLRLSINPRRLQLNKINKDEVDEILESRKNPDGWREYNKVF